MVRLVLLTAFALPLAAQGFPMRYLGNLGELTGELDLGVATASAIAPERVRIEGRDRAGLPWRFTTDVEGGLGDTTVWAADFDRDGQSDLLIGRHSARIVGFCVGETQLMLLLFDPRGRPVPWELDSNRAPEGDRYLPALVMDANRDGRAEFVLTHCERQDGWTSGVYEARAGRLVAANPYLPAYARQTGLRYRASSPANLMSGLDLPAREPIAEYRAGDFGCEATQPKPELPAPPLARYARIGTSDRDPCAGTGRPSLVTSRGAIRRLEATPTRVVIDGDSGREIVRGQAWPAFERLLREGYPVKWAGAWIWADAMRRAQPSPAVLGVEVEVRVIASRKLAARPTAAEGGCIEVRYDMDDSMLRRCPDGAWQRTWGSSREELLPDRRSVRTSHTAMGHTVSSEQRYALPPGGVALVGMAKLGDFVLTQWTGASGRFALHDEAGRLLAATVKVALPGDLAFDSDGVVLLSPSGELTAVHGQLRWRQLGSR